jgi:hypothetical protein
MRRPVAKCRIVGAHGFAGELGGRPRYTDDGQAGAATRAEAKAVMFAGMSSLPPASPTACSQLQGLVRCHKCQLRFRFFVPINGSTRSIESAITRLRSLGFLASSPAAEAFAAARAKPPSARRKKRISAMLCSVALLLSPALGITADIDANSFR